MVAKTKEDLIAFAKPLGDDRHIRYADALDIYLHQRQQQSLLISSTFFQSLWIAILFPHF